MDKMRWRYGDTNPVVSAVDAKTIIEIGDLLWQDTDNAKPASSTESPEVFKAFFLGVAMQRSILGCTAPIRVATTGVFEFDCPEEVYELGNLLRVANRAKLQRPENQFIRRTFDSRLAIGRVAKFQRVKPLPATVLIDIRSTVMIGGV